MMNMDALLESVAANARRAADFCALSAMCSGAFPGAVVAALAELCRRGGPAGHAAEQLVERSHADHRGPRPVWDTRLPLPHPLDFDWRFNARSADLLLDLTVAKAGPNGTALVAVCPTLLLRALDRRLRIKIVYASRLSDASTRALMRQAGSAVQFVDINDDLRKVRADAAIIDPPWYDDLAVPLVRQTASGTKRGGWVGVCVPDRLSGCSAASSLVSLDRHSKTFGLEGVRTLSVAVRYETPLFEINALKAVGISGAHPQWRSGRIVSARAKGPDSGRMEVPEASALLEVEIGTCVVRIRQDRGPSLPAGGPSFVVKPSVSRSSESGTPIGWTSGNRAWFPQAASWQGGRPACADARPAPTCGFLLATGGTGA